jgi:hypothetical protein
MFYCKNTAVYSGCFVRDSLIYAEYSLGFSSQIYVWNGKGSVKRFGIRFPARLAKLRRFCVWLAVKRLFAAVCGWY